MTVTTDLTPAAWKSGRLSYSTGLTLSIAKKMLEAGEKEAEKLGVPMTMAIIDAGGHLVAFSRMDDAILCSIQISMDKAFTAVFGKMPSGNWSDFYKTANLVPLSFHERWIIVGGGFPLIKNGVILGGIGLSGGVGEDLYVARAALKAGGFSLYDIDAHIAKIEGMEKEQEG